jgi:hypothetical protein
LTTIEKALLDVARAPSQSILVAIPPLTWGSEAKFVTPNPDFSLPQEVREAGFVSLLDREDVLKLLRYLSSKAASSRTAAEFVIHYSIYDAYPAWFDDLPNAAEATSASKDGR